MPYQIELSSAARCQLKKLDIDLKLEIGQTINALAAEPRPEGALKLKGEDNAYRVRVGRYRILYEIYDSVLIIIVIKIGHRREVYKNLD